MTKQYFSCAETAKLIRACLKETFPGTKFSVRSKTYSGGASINIGWTDGPNADQVKEITNLFEGKYFDGSIDYAGTRYGTLDGEVVRFGSDYIFTNRKYSDEMVKRAIFAVKAKYGIDQAVELEQFRKGEYWNEYPIDNSRGVIEWSLQSMINRDLGKRTRVLPQPSDQVKRIGFAGDDGYGQGTVGMPGGNGGEQAALGRQQALECQAALRLAGNDTVN